MGIIGGKIGFHDYFYWWIFRVSARHMQCRTFFAPANQPFCYERRWKQMNCVLRLHETDAWNYSVESRRIEAAGKWARTKLRNNVVFIMHAAPSSQAWVVAVLLRRFFASVVPVVRSPTTSSLCLTFPLWPYTFRVVWISIQWATFARTQFLAVRCTGRLWQKVKRNRVRGNEVDSESKVCDRKRNEIFTCIHTRTHTHARTLEMPIDSGDWLLASNIVCSQHTFCRLESIHLKALRLSDTQITYKGIIWTLLCRLYTFTPPSPLSCSLQFAFVPADIERSQHFNQCSLKVNVCVTVASICEMAGGNLFLLPLERSQQQGISLFHFGEVPRVHTHVCVCVCANNRNGITRYLKTRSNNNHFRTWELAFWVHGFRAISVPTRKNYLIRLAGPILGRH